ncbi:MAG TPA: hypothetical protein PLD23_17985 [Armatimonadota bacterium]|nr:hypothetical protein [Armatimonadota bacterium]HQK95392.1 hypothetical protein [Armatimonadota bacterium]
MDSPSWGDMIQLGSVGPILWFLYRMLPVLAKVGEAFTRLEQRIENHEQNQALLIHQHEEKMSALLSEQQRWCNYLLQRLNGHEPTS